MDINIGDDLPNPLPNILGNRGASSQPPTQNQDQRGELYMLHHQYLPILINPGEPDPTTTASPPDTYLLNVHVKHDDPGHNPIV